MTWTAPRTWVTGEVVTASHMNIHVRDNLLDLHTIGSLLVLEEQQCTADVALSTVEADITGMTTGALTELTGSYRYFVVMAIQFNVTTASAGVDLEAFLSINGTNRGPNILVEDSGATTADGMGACIWAGTGGVASPTYKGRCSKDLAGGVQNIKATNSTMAMAAFSAV